MQRIRFTLVFVLAATQALADEPVELTPETVVTATRIPTPIVDIPAGVTIIDRKTIEERGYTTLTDALSAVPGIHVSQSGGPGGNASVFVRGTNSNQVLVLRDGMPLNDASNSSGAFNFGTDTLADVERIEVIRGPMASLYGSGAIGGVINLISRQGNQPGLHVTSELAGGYPKQVEGNVYASGIDRAVLEVLEEGASVTDVARRYGVARQTVHEWLRRYANEGWRGWRTGRHGRSRARIRCPPGWRPGAGDAAGAPGVGAVADPLGAGA